MAEIKLTKNELRIQQNKLSQLQKYLPTLQLKKAMLQTEVAESRAEITLLEKQYSTSRTQIEEYISLLTEPLGFDPIEAAKVAEIKKRYENIAGVEVPYFTSVVFQPFWYSLFESPPWVDTLISHLRMLAEFQSKIEVSHEKKRALEKELREVSIRVNLFEKILIPRATRNIKKIKVFLGDQQLAAVSQAKIAKEKIVERKAQVPQYAR